MNMEDAVKVVRGEMDVTDVADSVPAPEINIDNVAEYIEMYKDNGQMFITFIQEDVVHIVWI